MTVEWMPLILTLKLSTMTMFILVLVGIPLGYWLAFSQNRWKVLIEPLVSMPLVMPPTVLGFYMLMIFSPGSFVGRWLDSVLGIQIVFSFTGLVVGSVIFNLPFMVNPVKAGFQNFPKILLEVSYTLGKSKWETLLKVVLPNIKASLLTGMIMTFAHTMGEFGVVLMMGGNIPDKTRLASIAIYSEVESLNYGRAHIYSGILFMTCFVILYVFHSLNHRKSQIF